MRLNDLRMQLTQDINSSQLDIDMIYFVVKDIYEEVSNLFNRQIQLEEESKKVKEEEAQNERGKE